MKIVYTLLLLIAGLTHINAQCTYSDPNIPKPDTGYGADGPYLLDSVGFTDPYFSTQNIMLYYPAGVDTPVPTIFYSHAFGGNDPINICGVYHFAVSHGYAFVFVPYQTIGVTVEYRYANLLNGFQLAAHNYPGIIDTTRVGFLGWSFGGGATYAIADTLISHNNWGSRGRFMYTLAPWYSYNISEAQLQSFPANTNLLIEIFDNDSTNDHRMAIDIYNTISIPDSQKNFVLLKSDTIGNYIYDAEHNVPNTSDAFNAFDYYAYYRLLNAMCDYTFNGNPAAKDVALGNGSAAQVTMPAPLKNLIEYANPPVLYPQSRYTYPCSDTSNPRSMYCPEMVSTGVSETNNVTAEVYPNPAGDHVIVKVSNTFHTVYDISLMALNGDVLLQTKLPAGENEITINTMPFVAGMYILHINSADVVWNKKITLLRQ